MSVCVKQRLDGFLFSSGTPQALIHLFKPDRRQHEKRRLQRQSSVSSIPVSQSTSLSASVCLSLSLCVSLSSQFSFTHLHDHTPKHVAHCLVLTHRTFLSMVLFSHAGRDVLTEDSSRTSSSRSHLRAIRAHPDSNALWDIDDTRDLTQSNPLHGPQTPRGPRDGLQRVLLPGH